MVIFRTALVWIREAQRQDLKMGEEDGVEMTKNKNNNVTGPIH